MYGKQVQPLGQDLALASPCPPAPLLPHNTIARQGGGDKAPIEWIGARTPSLAGDVFSGQVRTAVLDLSQEKLHFTYASHLGLFGLCRSTSNISTSTSTRYDDSILEEE